MSIDPILLWAVRSLSFFNTIALLWLGLAVLLNAERRPPGTWLAGGGLKAGHIHGQTDEFGFNVAVDPVHVHDLHATLLHLLGFDHTRLTFRFQGRDYRLTDVHGKLVKEIMA